jgi:alpha-amylase/alpha-mannosidase (GH57 family)
MKKIYLAFLWHQHQPMYKNPSTGVYELPWVRLHATKDYYDTAAILDDFPAIKGNFNLVPSLLAQLEEYAQGTARDKYLDLTVKPAQDLTQDERIFILHNFFMANWETMIYPYPRYLQLLEKRGRQSSGEELKRIQSYFRPADLRDLQVWFNLSWMDPYWKEHDPLVKALYQKERDFTEEEKLALVKKQQEICGLVVNKYRELQDRGQIEVSVTPFYHPILPLLCDTNNALGATPQINLPKKRFAHPEDARTQIRKAVTYYQERFGRPPRGMWPSEGSVAEDVIPIIEEAGIKWIATDEEILFRTQPALSAARRNLYQPYLLNIRNHQMNIIFRDHALSDAIGFVYTKWNASDAVSDFMKRLRALRDAIGNDAENHLVSVILDGENCWEYYANDGWDFLRLLYRTLSEDPSIETVTISDYLEKNPPRNGLRTLWPGSWINGNYGIWIGHAEDNLAWYYLGEARAFLTDYENRHPEKKDSPELNAAWELIFIAEGSDWNWWYGDDHSSGNDEMFDFLFRQNLIGVYETLNEKVPDYLYKSIKGLIRRQPTLEPIDFISPKIDGKITNYFEWQPAGFYQVGHSGGSMHQVETILKSFHYGFDLNNIYFRFDLNTPMNARNIEELSFKVVFLIPSKREVTISMGTGGNIRECILHLEDLRENLGSVAAGTIIELAIPVEKLRIPQELNNLEFVVTVLKNNLESERWPFQSSVTLPKPSEDFSLQTWSV